MANDYTVVTRVGRTQHGQELVTLANDLLDLKDRAKALNALASRMHDGANFDTVEAQFSLADTTIGGNLVTRLQQLDDILNNTTEVAGADRKARLDEFWGRLAGQ